MYKQIEDFENYLINEEGIVLNKKYNRQLLQPVNKQGYPEVQLWKNGKGYTKSVHRLVAQTFIPNPDNFPQVLHKDDDRRNPHIDNLIWGTNKQNMEQRDLKVGRGKVSKKKIMKLYKQKVWETADDFLAAIIKL